MAESLRTHLIDELTDLLDAENQLTKALPKMAASASTPTLKTALQKHLQETRGHIARLDTALRQLGQRPRRKTCDAMQGLISEGEEMMNNTPPGVLRDAVMITAAQKVEHYEMASYGTVRTYAQVLGERGVARLLAQTLKEEKAADAKLTTIAEGSVNEDAASEWQSSQEDESMLERSSAWMGATVTAASRQLASGARRAASAVGMAQDRPKRRTASRTTSTSRARKTARKTTTGRRRG
jgi:ferritin-like metal-binding protein YciE